MAVEMPRRCRTRRARRALGSSDACARGPRWVRGATGYVVGSVVGMGVGAAIWMIGGLSTQQRSDPNVTDDYKHWPVWAMTVATVTFAQIGQHFATSACDRVSN